MTVTLAAGLNKLDSALQLVSVPGEWTEGVNIQKITVIPNIVYLGESISIEIYTVNCQIAVPTTIHGTVVVNGATLERDWEVTFQNPTLKLTYTPTQIGTFAARAMGAAAEFTVYENIPDTYYSPFGKRVALCTDILIPDVAPFEFHSPKFSPPSFVHPGGDLIWSTLPVPIGPRPDVVYSTFSVPSVSTLRTVIAQLSKGRPLTWDPTDAVVSNWVGDYKGGGTYSTLTITATEYSCQEYWDSMVELADHLLRVLSPFVAICGGGYCTPQILCPYCNDWFYGPTHIQGRDLDGLSFVRDFIVHIETVHPNHPLTEPAWF
jgi:hypothetical protein